MKKLKGHHFPLDVIMIAVRWYTAYPLSYRHVEEFLKERGINADHSTVNRWVEKLSSIIKKGSESTRSLFQEAGEWMRPTQK